MALKYFCEYRTLNTQELWRVEIDMPDYEGTPIEKMAASEQACIIEYSGGDKLLEKFAIGSSASITLFFSDDAEVRELQLLGDKTSKVRVYRNGGTQLFWQGYLISDGIQFPDSGVMTPITLTAVDMLEAANDIPFANISAEAVTVEGQEGADNSPLNWIRKCLINPDNIDNRLPIRWSCSLKNLQYPSDDFFAGRTGFIPNYDIFASSRQSTYVGWMLENIAKSAECLFFQYGGYWYLVSITDLSQSSTLSFYEINGDDLSAKTASIFTLSLSATLPTKLNESTFSMVQKPISKVKATYNHSMPSNIIPNGGFDVVSAGSTLYWIGSSEDIVLSVNDAINNRNAGRALRVVNNGDEDGFISFSVSDVDTMPLDANMLFKDMEWGFTFLPINFVTDENGFIYWVHKQLELILSYTGYENNILKRFYLNEFGFWDGTALISGGLIITNVSFTSSEGVVTLAGNAKKDQVYEGSYIEIQNGRWVTISFSYTFTEDMDFDDAMTAMAFNTGGNRISYNQIEYPGDDLVNFSANIGGDFVEQPRIAFTVEGMKNDDVATIRFQSKGNQGRVLMPDPGVLDEMRALNSGKLALSIVIKAGQEVVFDDLYMNVSDNKEYWDISDGGSDGKAEYELEISSSFSGFMTSSYMDNFAKSDLSMIMDNGTDKGTLTEIFGKTALRFLSKPTEKIDTEIEGIYGLLNLFSYKSLNFLPLKSSINTENNSSKLTIFELNYDDGLELTSVHKSTGDGDNSSFSTGGYGGGGSGSGGGGAEFLFELGDVNIPTPSNNDALIYDGPTGKWVNRSKVSFAGVNVADFITIPTAVSADAATNGKWQVYIDVAGTGGGGVAPPVVVNLTDLQDVSISGVANGQALTYNTSTGKWVNSNIVTDLSNYYTKSESDARFKAIGWFPSWSEVTSKPTNFVFNDGHSYNIDVNNWNGQGYSPASENAGLTYLMGYNGTTSNWSYYNSSNVKNFLNIGDGSTLSNSISGNAVTVTNGVYTTGSYSNPSWITSLAWSKITGTPTTLSGYGITDAYPLIGNPSGFLTTTTAGTLYEPIFSKNTAFNKNFGTSSGTVAEGNDSRINNGQTAYTWGNHDSAGYALSNASNINVSAYKTVLGLPTSGAYDLQWVTNNGNFTNNFLKITGVNNIQNGDGLEFFYDGTTSQINSYGRGTTNTPLNLGFYAAKYLFEGGNVGIGIPSPNYKLDVNGNGNFTSSLQAQRIIAGYDSGVAGSVNGLYGRFSTNLQSPIITATAQQNIPVESGGVATGATWKIFVEL